MSGTSLDRSPPPLDYAGTPARKNTAARLALLFGIMAFVPLVTGVLAIAFGRRGLRDARDFALDGERMARWGIKLGLISVLAWSVAGSIYAVHARREAVRQLCRENLRKLGQAMLLYSNDNHGHLPPTLDHLVAGKYLLPADRAFTCPACAGDASKRPATVGQLVQSHYQLAGPENPVPPPPVTMYRSDGPEFFVLAWEPPSNHSGRGINLLLNFGRTTWRGGADAVRIDAELRAGLNPPPTLDPHAARLLAWMATTRPAAATAPAPLNP